MNPTNIYTKKKIDTSIYVNTLTGETLYSEYPDTTSINLKNESHVILGSKNFIMFDSNAFKYVQTICSPADLSKILRIADMVKGDYNFVCGKDGTPHIPKTLRIALDYDESEFSRFMQRLFKKSIIYYLSGYENGKTHKWIMLNPTLARKQNKVHKDCLMVFENLCKKNPEKKL